MPRQSVHRKFYKDARPSQTNEQAVQDNALIQADRIITSRGVQLDFLRTREYLTPDEITNLARWLYSLAHEARNAAASGLISESKSYDVIGAKVVDPSADV